MWSPKLLPTFYVDWMLPEQLSPALFHLAYKHGPKGASTTRKKMEFINISK